MTEWLRNDTVQLVRVEIIVNVFMTLYFGTTLWDKYIRQIDGPAMGGYGEYRRPDEGGTDEVEINFARSLGEDSENFGLHPDKTT